MYVKFFSIVFAAAFGFTLGAASNPQQFVAAACAGLLAVIFGAMAWAK